MKKFSLLISLMVLLIPIITNAALSRVTLDSDHDGITNEIDADDDNDGIMDINECTTSNFYWSDPPTVNGYDATGTIHGIQYTYTSTVAITTTGNMFNHAIFPGEYNVPNDNPTIQNVYPSSNTLTFASPMTNPVLVFSSIGGGPISVPITFSAPVQVLWSTAVVQNSPTQITGTEGYAIVRLNGTYSSISFDYLTYEFYVNFAFGADFYTYCDTDGDGITDNLDLDSDNDGCYDALEGSMGLNQSQIVNGMITGGVDASGIPLLAGSFGQEVGTSANASVNCLCELGIDNTAPVVFAKDNIVYLDASGYASITVQNADNGSYDNCGSISLSLDDMSFDCSDMGAKNVATIVSDNTWSQSTVELTTPGQYVSVVNQLPALSTYTLAASNAWPYGTVNFFSPPVPGALPIYANGGTKFYRNEFQLTGRPESLRIRARVDNIMEIFVNGVSIGMEDDIDAANFSNTVYHDVFIDDNGVQNGYMGGMQFDAVTSQSILDLLHEGSNEIVFAIANSNGTDQGGFMVRMDAVAAGVPVVLTATDPSGNSSSATAFVVVKDNLAPTITTQPIFLTLPANGTISITAEDVATVTDNCEVASVVLSQYAFGFNDALNSPVSVLVTATDLSGNETVVTAQVNVDYPAPTVNTQDITIQLDANGVANITPSQVDNGSASIAGPVSLSLNVSSFDCSTATISNPDYALSFDGTNDHVVIPANAAFESATTTFETWIKPYAGNTNQAFVSMRTSVSNTRYSLHINQAAGSMGIWNGTDYKTISNPFQINVWYHLTAVIAPGYTDFYVNGIYSGRVNQSMNLNVVGAPFVIGSTNDLDYTFEHLSGELDDIRVWNDIRTPQEILSDMNTPLNGNEQGLVAYYTMSDGPGSATLTDHSLNGFDGTLAYMDNLNDWTAGLYGSTNTSGNTVTLTVTDPYGKTATGTATVTVIDNLPPVITVHPIEVTLTSNGTVEITTLDVSTVTDNCEVTSVELNQYVFGASDALNSPVTIYVTATDASGNTSTQPTEVTVIDPVPVASCKDIAVELDANGQATITPEMVDNGSSSVVGVASLTLDKTSFDCSNTGANLVTLTVTSTLGSTATCTATVTVTDHIAPALTLPANMLVNTNQGLCGATVNFTATATDNCSATITYNPAPGSFFGKGITTVMVTATDAGGNVAQGSFTVEVIDNEPPTITCPFDITINNDAGICGAVVNYNQPTATDNCGTGELPTSIPDHTYKGTYSGHTYFLSNAPYAPEEAHARAIAAGGHLATISNAGENAFISAMLNDRIWIGMTDRDQEGIWKWISNEPVTYTNWSGGEPNNSGGNEDWAVINWAGPTWNDWYYTQPAYYVIEFDGGTLPAELVSGPESGSVFPVGTTEVTYSVTDDSGNSVECSFNVTVNDNEAPTVLLHNVTVELDENGQGSITPADVDLGSSDNCGIASISLNNSSFDCSNIGPNTITLTVIDVNGNVSSANAIVTVEDNVAPVATAHDLTIRLDDSGNASIAASDIDEGSSDACGIASLSVNPATFDCSNVGDNTVTLSVIDNNGNISTTTVIVTVQDVTPPVVLVKDITVQLDENGLVPFNVMEIDNGSSDVCGIQQANAAQTPLTCNNVGANEITLILTDIHGNSASATAVVTVEDNIAPIALAHDLTVQLDATGSVSIVAADVDNGSSDACGIDSITVDPALFDCSNIGTNEVILTVTDVHGNVSTTSSFVTVEDHIAPVVVAQDVTVNLDDEGHGSITVENINNGSSDACGIASLVLDNTEFDCSNVGANTVTLTATDVNGNIASAKANVTVNDHIVPDVLTQNVTIELDENGTATITPEMIDNGSSDACGIASLALDIVAFDCSNVGENTVTLTVTDVHQNASTADAIVTVEDNIAPSIVAPSDITQLNDPMVCGASVDLGEAITADNCSVGSVVNDAPDFFLVGTTTVTWTVTDVNGNSTSDTQQVVITNSLPVIDELTVGSNIEIDETVTASATFTDNNVLFATFEWGDGTSSEGSISGQTVTGEHAYATTGMYTVNLIIEDACGETTSQTYGYVIIWSACEGELTAGGWIDYSQNDWIQQPMASGKASFEVEAKYRKKGGLDGSFKFKIKTRGDDLELRSTQLDWLMINGGWAVVSGIAKVGREYGYSFQLSIQDGGNSKHGKSPDYARIIIWGPSGNVIFDNNQGSALDEVPGSTVVNGSIQIHKENNSCREKDYANNDHNNHNDDDHDNEGNQSQRNRYFNSCTIYPNPVDNDLSVQFVGLENETIYFSISDGKGSNYTSKQALKLNRGSAKTDVSRYRLKKGTYLITFQDGNGKCSSSQQFIKK